jgi:hypothetical protein
VPSGIWEESEYDKLPAYDGTTTEQVMKGALGVFHCHTAPDLICAGWAGCHDMQENLAVRFNWGKIDGEAVLSYESPVPLFASGAEAAEHGRRDIEEPSPEARKLASKIKRVRGI